MVRCCGKKRFSKNNGSSNIIQIPKHSRWLYRSWPVAVRLYPVKRSKIGRRDTPGKFSHTLQVGFNDPKIRKVRCSSAKSLASGKTGDRELCTMRRETAVLLQGIRIRGAISGDEINEYRAYPCKSQAKKQCVEHSSSTSVVICLAIYERGKARELPTVKMEKSTRGVGGCQT